MKLFSRIFSFLYFPYVCLIFLVTMIGILPFVFIASFFGKIKGGNAIYRLCMLWGDILFLLAGIRHRNIFEAKPDPNRQYIFVANHISYLDAPLIVKSLRRPIRALGKYEMSKAPIFGYIYRKAIVMVDRSNAEKRARSVRTLKSVLRKGISIFIFPEGTFNLTDQPLKEFYDGAFRIAIETQMPIQPLLFLDSYDRMHHQSVLTLNPGRSRTIFLEPIEVTDYALADVQELKDKVHVLISKKLMEYGATWVSF